MRTLEEVKRGPVPERRSDVPSASQAAPAPSSSYVCERVAPNLQFPVPTIPGMPLKPSAAHDPAPTGCVGTLPCQVRYDPRTAPTRAIPGERVDGSGQHGTAGVPNASGTGFGNPTRTPAGPSPPSGGGDGWGYVPSQGNSDLPAAVAVAHLMGLARLIRIQVACFRLMIELATLRILSDVVVALPELEPGTVYLVASASVRIVVVIQVSETIPTTGRAKTQSLAISILAAALGIFVLARPICFSSVSSVSRDGPAPLQMTSSAPSPRPTL